MSQLRYVVLVLLFSVCALGQTLQQGRPDGLPKQPAALVRSLYREVVARHPTGLPRGADMNVFAPYLSKRLLHRIALANACARDWTRQDQKRMSMGDQIPEKAPFGWAESGIFSGAAIRTSRTVRIAVPGRPAGRCRRLAPETPKGARQEDSASRPSGLVKDSR